MGMSDTKTVQIAGHGRASRKLISMATAVHGDRFATRVDAMLADAIVVKGLSRLLSQAYELAVGPDGRIDFDKAAMHMFTEMRRHQK